jgi:hypothetical protein
LLGRANAIELPSNIIERDPKSSEFRSMSVDPVAIVKPSGLAMATLLDLRLPE